MVIGLIGSSVIHLSQGFMRFRWHLQRHGEGTTPRARWYFRIGLAMNLTAPLWVVVANRFAPTVFFTSMYAVGLIPLLLFACLKMDECLGRLQVLGIALIVAGTVVIAMIESGATPIPMQQVSAVILIGILIAWAALAVAIPLLVLRRPSSIQPFFFGIAAGGMLALDALLKGVAQASSTGASTLLPSTASAMALFLFSFCGAVGAFLMMQWSYRRQHPASLTVPLFDVAYVALPILVLPVAAGTGNTHPACLLGLALLAAGALLMRPLPSS